MVFISDILLLLLKGNVIPHSTDKLNAHMDLCKRPDNISLTLTLCFLSLPHFALFHTGIIYSVSTLFEIPALM